MNKDQLFEFLEFNSAKFNQEEFIENDPIKIPHQFTVKEDIEISAFLTASIAWGNRSVIIRNAFNLMERMDFAPADFVVNSREKDLAVFAGFKHRTFQTVDLQFFIRSLQNIYQNFGGLEKIFSNGFKTNAKTAIIDLNGIFNAVYHEPRSEKHLSNPAKNSAAKRINMFLRWMVRKDNKGVDFGLWKSISPADLMLPLDVHTARTGRGLELLIRKQNDWKAVEEITAALKSINPTDPIKYDFALFGYGVSLK